MRFQFGFSGLLLNVRTDALIKLFRGFLSLSLSDLVCDRYIQHQVLAVHVAHSRQGVSTGSGQVLLPIDLAFSPCSASYK